jgi:hypothetical protein
MGRNVLAASVGNVLFRGTGETQSAVHGRGNVYAPDVHFFAGQYWMWFGGQGRDGHDRIHLAVSTNAVDWVQRGVVLDNGTANHVNDPSVVRIGTQWWMYYTVAQTDILDEIALAVSGDGLKWEKKGVVLSKGNPPSFDSLLLGRPSVLYQSGLFRMWYDGRMDINTNAAGHFQLSRAYVGYAESTDGTNWIRKALAPSIQMTALHVFPWKHHLIGVYESGGGTRYASSQDGLSWVDHGLLLAKQGDAEKWGHVTPFIFYRPEKEELRLFYGAASEKGWDANIISMSSLNGTTAFPLETK